MGLPLISSLSAAAWAFYEEHKSEIGWDLVALNPPLVNFFLSLLA